MASLLPLLLLQRSATTFGGVVQRKQRAPKVRELERDWAPVLTTSGGLKHGTRRVTLTRLVSLAMPSDELRLQGWLEQSLTPHSTQCRSFRRRSSQPVT